MHLCIVPARSWGRRLRYGHGHAQLAEKWGLTITLPSSARILTSKFVAAVWKRSRFISEKDLGAARDSIAMAKSKIGTSCRVASSFLCKLGVAAIAAALSVTSVGFAAQPSWTMFTPATP